MRYKIMLWWQHIGEYVQADEEEFQTCANDTALRYASDFPEIPGYIARQDLDDEDFTEETVIHRWGVHK